MFIKTRKSIRLPHLASFLQVGQDPKVVLVFHPNCHIIMIRSLLVATSQNLLLEGPLVLTQTPFLPLYSPNPE